MEAQRNAVTWPRSLHAIVLVHALEIWFFYAVCLRNSPDVSIKAQWHASLLCPTKAFLALTWLLSQTQAGNPKITERLISRYGDVFTHIWYPHCQSLNCDWRIIASPPPDSNIQVMQKLQITLLKQPMEQNMQFLSRGTASLNSLLLALKGRPPGQPETTDRRMINTPKMEGCFMFAHRSLTIPFTQVSYDAFQGHRLSVLPVLRIPFPHIFLPHPPLPPSPCFQCSHLLSH